MTRGVSLTRRGWSLLGAAVGLLVAGRLLGTAELTTLGLSSLALIVGSVLWTGSRPLPLELHRTVRPARVHVGTDARVDLVVESWIDKAADLNYQFVISRTGEVRFETDYLEGDCTIAVCKPTPAG